MKKHFLKSFALIAMLFSALTMSAASGIDWSTYDFLGDGAGGGLYANKYKVSTAEGIKEIVNIQHPGFGTAPGIYISFVSAVESSSVKCDIQGAGVLLHLSAFTAQETQVTVKYEGGAKTCTFWVYYVDGTTDGTDNPGTDNPGTDNPGTDTPDTEEPDLENAKELFNPATAFIPEGGTYFAPNWAQETNSTAAYDATTGTLSVDLKSQFYGQWQAQVKLQHDVDFSADKQYVLSVKFKSTVDIGGITVKMDDNTNPAVAMANQTIALKANEEYVYTSEPGNGVAGNNHILVFDFGWAVPALVTISDISIKEVGGAVAPPVVEHPAAATAPTLPAAQVFSIYSDAYTSTATRGTGSWGQSTIEQEVQLAEGDKAFYYTTSNYLGWELNGNTTIGDMTAYPKLHMDIYVAEAGAIEFTPIWGAEALKKYTLQAGWNAIDIDLATDFVGVNLANIFQLKWAAMPATCYIDNVYFYSVTPSATEDVSVKAHAKKLIENGQMIIISNGVRYNALGMQIK